MNKKSTTGVVVGSLLFITSGLFAAGDPTSGKTLYKKNSQCMQCHNSDIFKKGTNGKRTVHNLDQLEAKVRLCDSKRGPRWFEKDIKDVVAYLNTNFYKF